MAGKIRRPRGKETKGGGRHACGNAPIHKFRGKSRGKARIDAAKKTAGAGVAKAGTWGLPPIKKRAKRRGVRRQGRARGGQRGDGLGNPVGKQNITCGG